MITLPRKEAKKRKNEEAETEKAKRRKTKKAKRKETEKAERRKTEEAETEEAKKKKSEEAETEDAKKRKGEEAQSERNESKLGPKEVFLDGTNSKDPKHESKSPPSKSSPSQERVIEKLYVPSITELNLIRMSRHHLEKMMVMPCFASLAIGCFVRIGIGQNGNEIYVAAQILDVCETSNVYMVGSTRTNKVCIKMSGFLYSNWN